MEDRRYQYTAAQYERVAEERDQLRDQLHSIKGWAEAYPLEVFPEPDFAKAAALLEAGGMTIDAISASNMRHVLKGATLVR